MDLYTLDSDFLPKASIDSFMSVIWTERFNSAGEVSLVVEATPEMQATLAPDTFLMLKGTNEVMILETQTVENGLLTVTGMSLLGFLKQRIVYLPRSSFPFNDPVPTHPRRVSGFEYSGAYGSGFAITDAVKQSVVDNTYDEYDTIDEPELQLNWPLEMIPNLTIHEDSYIGEDYVLFNMALGASIYDGIRELAELKNIGIRMYLESADIDGYSLKFLTYLGEDRTTEGTKTAIVRFSPHLDSLSNIKAVNSIAQYKNVVYAQSGAYAVVEVTAVGSAPEGFDRRVMFISPEIPEGTDETQAWILFGLAGLNALANNTIINIFDGQVGSQSLYQFGTHYGLGDIVELQDIAGNIQKVRVTEYIRAQDNSGERAYPTVSVIIDT